MENLWPKFEKSETDTPKALLLKQVEYFNNLETGLRANLQSALSDELDVFIPETFVIHTLRIQATALNGFTFTLLRVRHKPVQIFPVEIHDSMRSKDFSAKDQKEMQFIMAEIFNSKETIEAINNILSQIKS